MSKNEQVSDEQVNLDEEVTYKEDSAAQQVPQQSETVDEADLEIHEDGSAEDEASSSDAEIDPKLAELEAEVDMLKKQAEENQQRYLRAQADFDNFRRRTRAEKEQLTKYGSLDMLEKLLPVIDNFDRALGASQQNQDYDALLKGLEMIHKQFNQILDEEDLKTIQAVGEPFNPEYHQAVMQVESDDHEEGIVVEEIQKGYMFKDKVIRPTMVKVSQ